jgi:hypothetical protein
MVTTFGSGSLSSLKKSPGNFFERILTNGSEGVLGIEPGHLSPLKMASEKQEHRDV